MTTTATYNKVKTNIAWMPELPEHWKLSRGKNLFIEKSIKNFPNEPLLAASQKQGVVLKTMLDQKSMEAIENFETFKLVDINDFVISLRSFEGGIEIAYYRGIISPVYNIFNFRNSKDYCYDFFKYLFKSRMFIQELNIYKKGIRDGQSINYKEFANIIFPVPPYQEQIQIANYLDTKSQKINHFIAKKQQFIALLKEQRQSVINEAVTKGGNNWITKRLKYLGKIYSGLSGKVGADFSEESKCNSKFIPFTSISNSLFVNSNRLNNVFIDINEQQNIVKQFDLLFLMSSETQEDIGKCAILLDELDGVYLNSFCKGFRVSGKLINPEYLNYCLNSFHFRNIISIEGRGFTRINLRQGALLNILLTFPKSLSEQTQIINHIKTETATIDTAIAKTEREIELIKEYKEAMIAEAVMGKINLSQSTTAEQPKVKKETTWEFKEAVLIAILTDKFSSAQYPIGRKRYTKFSYLFHRYTDNKTEGYLKKAAGPYNPKTKYAGPEKIALQNKYVIEAQNGNLSGFVAGSKIDDARNYFKNYWEADSLNWLEKLKYKKNDELELIATIDKAIAELNEKEESINLTNIKKVITETKDWKAKLEREIFSDDNITRAVNELKTFFN